MGRSILPSIANFSVYPHISHNGVNSNRNGAKNARLQKSTSRRSDRRQNQDLCLSLEKQTRCVGRRFFPVNELKLLRHQQQFFEPQFGAVCRQSSLGVWIPAFLHSLTNHFQALFCMWIKKHVAVNISKWKAIASLLSEVFLLLIYYILLLTDEKRIWVANKADWLIGSNVQLYYQRLIYKLPVGNI